jgi:hypothetical protein
MITNIHQQVLTSRFRICTNFINNARVLNLSSIARSVRNLHELCQTIVPGLNQRGNMRFEDGKLEWWNSGPVGIPMFQDSDIPIF